MSDSQPTAFDGLDSGSLAELAGTGRTVWDSPAVGGHDAAGDPGWVPHPVCVDLPDGAPSLVPGDVFFV